MVISLADDPAGAGARPRVVPILNGLGSVKYEELFVVYRRVAQLLAEAGLEAIDPQVGELVTSFDMAGTSLTLFWLDDELESLWNAPADAPAFRRGAVTAAALDSAGQHRGRRCVCRRGGRHRILHSGSHCGLPRRCRPGASLGEGLLDYDYMAGKIQPQERNIHQIVEHWLPWQDPEADTVRLENQWTQQSLDFLRGK